MPGKNDRFVFGSQSSEPQTPDQAVTERPILFSAPMVRALLAGTKTQTRRIVKPQPKVACPSVTHIRYELHPFSRAAMDGTPGMAAAIPNQMAWVAYDWVENPIGVESLDWMRNPYGQPGDRLWVKETWNVGVITGRWTGVNYQAGGKLDVPATHPGWSTWWNRTRKGWIPSIFMSRWGSRITLEIVSVRVERLQDISEEDAIAEGIESCRPAAGCEIVYRDYAQKSYDPFEWFSSPINSYRSLWESINGDGSWAANPWVWVIEFRRVAA